MTKPIRIRLTNEYLAMYVDLEQQPSGSSTRCFLGLDLASLLKYSAVAKPRHKKLLIVYWSATKDGDTSKRKYFRRMQSVAGSMGWTVVQCRYLPTLKEDASIWQCPAISKMVKRYA